MRAFVGFNLTKFGENGLITVRQQEAQLSQRGRSMPRVVE